MTIEGEQWAPLLLLVEPQNTTRALSLFSGATVTHTALILYTQEQKSIRALVHAHIRRIRPTQGIAPRISI